jgi:hypothetical protein
MRYVPHREKKKICLIRSGTVGFQKKLYNRKKILSHIYFNLRFSCIRGAFAQNPYTTCSWYVRTVAYV